MLSGERYGETYKKTIKRNDQGRADKRELAR